MLPTFSPRNCLSCHNCYTVNCNQVGLTGVHAASKHLSAKQYMQDRARRAAAAGSSRPDGREGSPRLKTSMGQPQLAPCNVQPPEAATAEQAADDGPAIVSAPARFRTSLAAALQYKARKSLPDTVSHRPSAVDMDRIPQDILAARDQGLTQCRVETGRFIGSGKSRANADEAAILCP
jgi:hypothetical protein